MKTIQVSDISYESLNKLSKLGYTVIVKGNDIITVAYVITLNGKAVGYVKINGRNASDCMTKGLEYADTKYGFNTGYKLVGVTV